MKYDYSKLTGLIIEKFKTRCNFADAMNMKKSSISMKLNNRAGFSQEEIIRAMELLEIPPCELDQYFFKQKI
ncbi:DUF739 family protein [Fusobacterium necrophorum]|uniref:DUF739 family protein n=1 Tax=Fusobacterium necrophorum TaxID=859 RepID=UPI00254D2B39|nr:DUF739 family protein [Fusobacterium necrophorum]MCI7344228.1 DUF739 family protein [Fusobacterium necrophorum]MDK4495291.1 DUF739 family protein [Fusobacterium necrophorum]MDK4509344.1 DUF739 family protein [Fusobacterium necrophorum]